MATEKKFKVCLVAISLAKGGLERSCAMLSQMLEQKGHEVHLVVLNDAVDNPYSGVLFNLGKFKKGKDSSIKRMRRFKKFRKYLQQQKFDVIIDHRPKNRYLRELFYDRYVYRNMPRIYVVHNSKKSKYLTEKIDSFSKICNGILTNVAVSEHIEKEILQSLGIKNTITIHNAYHPDWENGITSFPEVLKDKTYILSYGRLDDAVKDFSFAIQAFSESEVWKKGVYLVILGEGKDAEMLQQLAASKDCASQILFLPYLKNPFEIIKNARCVTLTSKYEGFPMVLVESLSLGTPVVSLDIVSGPSEIVQNGTNGFLIGERSIPLFAEALEKICFDEELYQELKKNAKPTVKQFSMENIAEKWNKLLQDVLP